METGALGMGFIVAAIFVGCVLLFGLSLLFVRATNIERNWLVGLLTVVTAGIAIALLAFDYRQNFPFGAGALVSTSLLSLLGYGIGRGIDALLGPDAIPADNGEATLGADLAD